MDKVTTNLSDSNILCTNIDQSASTSSYTTPQFGSANSGSNKYNITMALPMDVILNTNNVTIDNITLKYKIYGLNNIGQVLGAKGTVMTGYKDSAGSIQYEDRNKHITDIGKGSSSASSYTDVISAPYVSTDGKVVLCMYLENPIAAAINQFTISDLSIEINYTLAPYKVKLNVTNAIEGDIACLLAADGSSLNVTESEFAVGDRFGYYVKTCDGRSIKSITVYRNGVIQDSPSGFFDGYLSENNSVFQLNMTVTEEMCGLFIEYIITLNDPCVIKISAVNAGTSDQYYIMSADKTENHGETWRIPLQSAGWIYYAKAAYNSKIEKIQLIVRDGAVYEHDREYLLATDVLSPDCKTLEVPNSWFAGTICDNTTYEMIVYFEGNSYAVYVGQTQALRVYVGQTEILNIV